MKVGIFSDVHANIEALSAVTAALEQESPDMLLCGGDVVGYGASPNECCDIVRTLSKSTVLGNHDAAVAGRMDYSYYYEAARNALDLHAQVLTEENMEWLKSLPYKKEFSEIGLDICHGSPVRLEEFDYIFAPEQAAECLPIWDKLAPLTLIGHSHLCKVFALRPGDVRELPAEKFELDPDTKYIVSVGSVGQPRDYDNRASYTMYDSDAKTFDFFRVEYDIEAAAEKIIDGNLEQNFAHRLFIGV